MSSLLIRLVSAGGVAAIFLTMALESAGIPISSEVVVPLGGALSAQGRLSFVGVVAAATLGNLVGSLVAFLLARRYGRPLILGPGRRVGLNEGHLRLAERFFGRFGSLAVFIGRLLPVVRTYISFPAGLAAMGLARFAALTLLGSIPWNLGLAYAGYRLGREGRRSMRAGTRLRTVRAAVLMSSPPLRSSGRCRQEVRTYASSCAHLP